MMCVFADGWNMIVSRVLEVLLCVIVFTFLVLYLDYVYL